MNDDVVLVIALLYNRRGRARLESRGIELGELLVLGSGRDDGDRLAASGPLLAGLLEGLGLSGGPLGRVLVDYRPRDLWRNRGSFWSTVPDPLRSSALSPGSDGEWK